MSACCVTSNQTFRDATEEQLLCFIRVARGPQYHPSRNQPSCQEPYHSGKIYQHKHWSLFINWEGSGTGGGGGGVGYGVVTCFQNKIYGG